jgi:hypothetical protein
MLGTSPQRSPLATLETALRLEAELSRRDSDWNRRFRRDHPDDSEDFATDASGDLDFVDDDGGDEAEEPSSPRSTAWQVAQALAHYDCP